MQTSLDPALVRFELDDGAPIVRLLVEQPHEATLEGWYLVRRTIICMITGPGDTGFVFPHVVVPAPAGWHEAVTARGGASVRFGTDAEPGPFAENV